MSTVVWPVNGLRAGISGVNYPIMTSEKLHQPDLAVHYPRVLLSRAEARGADPAALLKAAGIDESLLDGPAAAIELIHAFSLVHDDLPAMDDDDLRRGRPSNHRAFDEATAILAGDALQALAFEVLAASLPAERPSSLEIVLTVAAACGSTGMAGGQALDLAAVGRTLSAADLNTMHRLKTGALIEASVRCGAELAGVNSTQIQMLERYAQNIGLAFQVTDDILNVEGDPAIMGKAVGTDEQRHKTTYPALLGLTESKEFADRLIRNALAALDDFDQKAEPLRAIAHYIRDRNR